MEHVPFLWLLFPDINQGIRKMDKLFQVLVRLHIPHETEQPRDLPNDVPDTGCATDEAPDPVLIVTFEEGIKPPREPKVSYGIKRVERQVLSDIDRAAQIAHP